MLKMSNVSTKLPGDLINEETSCARIKKFWKDVNY